MGELMLDREERGEERVEVGTSEELKEQTLSRDTGDNKVGQGRARPGIRAGRTQDPTHDEEELLIEKSENQGTLKQGVRYEAARGTKTTKTDRN